MQEAPNKSGPIVPKYHIPCGTLCWKLSDSSYRGRYWCRRWECPVCNKFRTGKFQEELNGASLAVTTYVLKLPPVTTKQEATKLTNFLRQVKGTRWVVKSDLRIIVIAKKAFTDADREQTLTLISNLVPSILKEPWTKKGGQRITRPRNQKEKVIRHPHSPVYAISKNPEVGDIFENLKTDYERGRWLSENPNMYDILYHDGKKLVAAYEAEREATGRGPAPLQTPALRTNRLATEGLKV